MAKLHASARPDAPLLSGSLAAFPPLDVLQWLAYRRGAVQLTFRQDGVAQRDATRRLQCCDGRLIGLVVEAGAGELRDRDLSELVPLPDRLGGRLLAAGALDLPSLRYALVLQRLSRSGPAPRLGALLRAHDLCAAQACGAALRELAWMQLADLVGWRRGRFALRAADSLATDLPIEEPIERVLLRLARAIDDSARRQPPGGARVPGGTAPGSPRCPPRWTR